ncbi:hypothetical protein FOZ62_008754 [Perkinsus olseni]|uniref:Uncharacterized protein n=1 Tax=Perkinsus olseni TaxID=32597 RepID=A0A7J6SJT6_PEROL|nr:hypothetical protein FOZ62_008754 [Perkinsus olseni]
MDNNAAVLANNANGNNGDNNANNANGNNGVNVAINANGNNIANNDAAGNNGNNQERNFYPPSEDVVAMVKALAASSEVADEVVNSLGVNGLTSAQLLGSLSSASMARVTSTLSIAAAATLESLAEEVGSVIRKRRKLHAESDAATQRSTVQVEAIINQSVKNFHSPLPPSLFYGVSTSVIAADIMEKSGLPGDDSIDGKDKRRSDGGPGPKAASKNSLARRHPRLWIPHPMFGEVYAHIYNPHLR